MDGTLMYLRNFVLLQESLSNSFLKQKIGDLRVEHLVQVNIIMQEARVLNLDVKYIRT